LGSVVALVMTIMIVGFVGYVATKPKKSSLEQLPDDDRVWRSHLGETRT